MRQIRSQRLILAGMTSLLLVVTGCTTKGTTDATTDVLSSTTPGAWFTGDGLLKADQKVNAFVAFNFENVKQDMARGEGEYLTSLSQLMGVAQDRQASFFAHAQSQYPFVVEKHSGPRELIALLTASAAKQ